MKDKIAHYETASGTDSTNLDAEVRRRLKEGWQPYGNPYRGDGILYQAMVLIDAADSKEWQTFK
jgi:hypothetical protein